MQEEQSSGGEGLVELRHPAPDVGSLSTEADLEPGIGYVKRRPASQLHRLP
ncbi:MAG: hypothetical protein MZU91_13115 [Desulfosudis oleivorans]|nr:hypothetical protein [Desulfosudis oleivorans]